ncbi:MAG: hypothetical protein ACO4CG_13780, partial [Prochlorothrix sp.]
MGEFKEHQGCQRGRPSDALTYGNTIALSLLEDCLLGGMKMRIHHGFWQGISMNWGVRLCR